MKIFRQRVSRAQNIQPFSDKESRLLAPEVQALPLRNRGAGRRLLLNFTQQGAKMIRTLLGIVLAVSIGVAQTFAQGPGPNQPAPSTSRNSARVFESPVSAMT